MPYINDNAFEALDLFMTSIGRKRAWDVLKKKLGNKCEEDGCEEAIEQTKINKENIEANATNITQNTTNINKNAESISELKDIVDNIEEVNIDSADFSDIDNLFN